MANYIQIANNLWVGLAADTKPTNSTVPSGAICIEFNASYTTTTFYVNNGTTWTVSIPPAERTGTATGAANGSATVFNIAHGLGAVPYSAFVQPSSVLGSNIAYSYTYDSTNIVVTFASAPSSGTITFQWRVVL